ncbi:UDP-galactose transporter 1 [Wickerhamiella sorbophila]|uniref:UDP-galactose transporter homolog 1 n=1 Tax=Wickerhamiella sorbophila TaxID=45607 RepID=A0A2T0FIR4_9ASCO|nr:UDP-galactose transporter 1 [Wickerhamiella sorbophila]PRT54875.1 UDP-galactose transporter 1 [Wickerhamiella sorbophila]
MSVRQRKKSGSEKEAETEGLQPEDSSPGILTLMVCVGGIYASFLTWAVLQERIATTSYGLDNRVFRAAHVINGTQNLLACVSGILFLSYKRWTGDKRAAAPLIPSREVASKYLLVAACQALSSPFAYASLKYVDYLTMLLAKSCKLLPVMAVSLLLYRTHYPAYKYAVVLLITAGVCLFSVMQPSSKQSTSSEIRGIALLGANLFLDGLYNTTQDRMFAKYKMITGAHMMAVLNFITTVLTFGAFLISPEQKSELHWFVKNHPAVLRDIFLFGLCGAIGQIFIFLTLEKFGSLVLVTTTVTRKMMSMLLSVVMFNHRLVGLQWVGVGLVFTGVIGEALWKRLVR